MRTRQVDGSPSPRPSRCSRPATTSGNGGALAADREVEDRLFEGEEAVLHVIEHIVAPLGLPGWCENHWMRARLVGALIGLVLGTACTSGAEPAPNLLSPTPSPDAEVAESGLCAMLPVRAQPISDQQLVRGLGAYVPTWLPTGFGLVGGWSGHGATAIWIDRRCHRITLEVFSPDLGGVAAPAGQWHLTERGYCTYGDGVTVHRVPCVSWKARSGRDALLLSTRGVSDAAAARIRAGIALTV